MTHSRRCYLGHDGDQQQELLKGVPFNTGPKADKGKKTAADHVNWSMTESDVAWYGRIRSFLTTRAPDAQI